MYTSATQDKCVGLVIHLRFSQDSSRKQVIRGAVTNGAEWTFIILNLDENGKGGEYRISRPLVIESDSEPFGPGRAVLLAILTHWVRCYLFSPVWYAHGNAVVPSLPRKP